MTSRPFDPFDPQISRASAGTGKTFALSSRYIGLLAAGEPADAILATTFTRKAAGEIHDRVLARLARAALGDAVDLDLLRRFAGAPDLTADRAGELLTELLRRLHRLSVCTLDSFFVRIAGSFTFELGLPPGWRIGDEVADQRLRADAVAALLDADDPQRLVTLIRSLNPGEVRRAVVDQISTLVDELYSVYQRQPAREAWCWIDPPPPLSDDLIARAVEAFADVEALVPRTGGGKPDGRWIKAIQGDLDNARSRDWKAFIDGGLGKVLSDPSSAGTYYRAPVPEPLARAYRPLLLHARAMLLGELAERTEATWRLLSAFDREYTRLQGATRAVRFDTITRALGRAAVAERRLEELYFRLDARIHHLLLDEFQDTSGEQWRVLKPIAAEVVAQGRESRRSFYCVGDVKQAIYGWRGGEAEVFDALESAWPQIAVVRDSTTRRCSGPVIDAVNAVFGSIDRNGGLDQDAEAAAAWGAAFDAHATHEGEAPGYVRFETAPPVEDDGPSGGQYAETIRRAAALVSEIHAAAPGASIGVLTRTNRAVAQMIFELRRREIGIIASEEGGNPLTDSPAVASVLALVRMADHPGDTAARFLVANSPVGELVGLRDHTDDAGACRVASQVRFRLAGEGYGPVLWDWVGRLAGACDRRDLTRLLQLVELGHAFEADASLRPGHFVAYVESKRIADPTASPVRVMTVHQAKGLEFDAVVLCELDVALRGVGTPAVLAHFVDRTQPPVRVVRYAGESHQRLEPELATMAEAERKRRVCESLSTLYVAMTRPRYALYMVVAPSRGNERTLPRTYAGVLRSALIGTDPLPEPGVQHEGGDDQWYERVDRLRSASARVRESAERGERCIALAPAGKRSRGLPRRSPSSLEGGQAVRLGDRMNLAAAGALEAGTRAHALLERLAWIDDGPPALEPAESAQLQRILSHAEIRSLFVRSTYPDDAEVELLRERPFAIRMGDTLLSGTFDRVVLMRRGGAVVAAELIDFKTDSAVVLAQRVEHYRPQIEAYRRALAAMHRIDAKRVVARLAFVNAGVVRTV